MISCTENGFTIYMYMYMYMHGEWYVIHVASTLWDVHIIYMSMYIIIYYMYIWMHVYTGTNV